MFIDGGGSSAWLTDRMSALGYPPQSDGICFGIANMGETAFLLGELEAFNTRLIKISEQNPSSFIEAAQTLPQQSLKELDPFITECLSFFDPLMIYQSPDNYNELFEAEVQQTFIRQVDWLLPKKMSEQRAECSKFSNVYDLQALETYLDLIKRALDENQIQLTSLILSCADHALQVGYDSAQNQWTMVEANYLPGQVVDNIKDLAFKIFASFYDGEEEEETLSLIDPMDAISIFSTTLSVNASEKERALQALSRLEATPQWQELQQPTPAKVAAIDSLESNWLYEASKEGDAATVNKILSTPGINVNQQNTTGNFPLSIACLYGLTDVVKMLLSHPDIDATMRTDTGATAILLACQHGHNNIINLFRTRPDIKNLLAIRDEGGYSPLDCAVHEKNVELVRLLRSMDQTIDINWQDDECETILFVACRSDHIDLLLALSEFVGINYDLPNMHGHTPFMAACRGAHLLQAKWLVEHQAVNINHVDTAGDNALITAIESKQADIFHYLLTLPHLELNHQDSNNDTAFTLACEQGNTPFIFALINRRCNIALKNIDDETGFDILIRKKQWQAFFTVFNLARTRYDNPQQFISAEHRTTLALVLQQINQQAAARASNNGLFSQRRLPEEGREEEANLQPLKRSKTEEDDGDKMPALDFEA